MNASGELDPVTLSVLWNSLISITEEMGSALRRTAFSDAVREGDDFSTGLFDGRGRLIAQGNFTPGHLGAMPYVVDHVLRYYPPGTLAAGDSVLLNDSFLGGGHFPDFFLITPVFLRDSVIAYAVNTAHHVDIGGAAAGSQRVQGVTEAFQEGLRILPIRIARKGELDVEMSRLILANVRLPEKVQGDLRAQLNANHVGAERVTRIFELYGTNVVVAACDEILARSEKETREIIRTIPNGRYEFSDLLDDFGIGTAPIRVHVAVTIREEDIEIDFAGSSDQVAAAINCYINYTRAYGVFAAKVLSGISIPNNAGSFRPIAVTAPEGSFFNARFPAPSGGRAAVQIRIFDAINGAFSKVLPERVMGAFSHWGNPNISGLDRRTGRPFIVYDVLCGGYGGRLGSDGAEALSPVMNCSNIPVEVHEVNGPVVVERLELIADSGGAGEFRGGCGLRKDIRIVADEVVVTLLGDRHKFAPYGLFGAEPGAIGATILNPGPNQEMLSSKEVRSLSYGDVLSFRLSGAGGYGPATARSKEAIERDVEDGLVTMAAAIRRYSYPS